MVRRWSSLRVSSAVFLSLPLYPCGLAQLPLLWFSPNIIQFHSFVFRLGRFSVRCEDFTTVKL